MLQRMMASKAVDVSVVTITYNGLDDTRRMIRSLQQTVRSVSYEIIVVDNASTQDEAAILAGEFGEGITTIRSKHNLGFSGGNNLGILRAKGRYIFLLNNDTYIEQDGLGKLVEFLDANSRIGAASPKIRFGAPTHLIQYAGWTPLTGITQRNFIIGYKEEDKGQHDTPAKTPFANGAAMIVRREAIKAAGLMPELYFLYYEELDWCISIHQAGYEIWYVPALTVFHNDGYSGKPSPLRTFYMTRNRMLLAWRKGHATKKWLSIAYQMGVAVPKNAAVAALKGNPKTAAAMFKAYGAFLSMPGKNARLPWKED